MYIVKESIHCYVYSHTLHHSNMSLYPNVKVSICPCLWPCPWIYCIIRLYGHMDKWTYGHLDKWILGHNREVTIIAIVGEFCHYTFGLFIHFVVIHFVVICFFLSYVCRSTFCLFIRFVFIHFVLMHFVVIFFVVIRFVTESVLTLAIIQLTLTNLQQKWELLYSRWQRVAGSIRPTLAISSGCLWRVGSGLWLQSFYSQSYSCCHR
jgi:hypothetical protein